MSGSSPLHDALLRADLWRVLALAFGPPTAQSLTHLQELCQGLVASLGSKDLAFRDGLSELAQGLEGLDPIELEHECNALFSMDVLVPAYEGSYQRIERGSVVGDVAGYYKAFGLEAADNSGPPDSLWNELAFLSWLSIKEGYAVEHELEEELSVTRDAEREFLQDHLGRWTGAFTQRLLSTTDNPFFVTSAHLLLATVSRVADELEVGEIRALEGRELTQEPDAVDCPVAPNLAKQD